MTLAQSGAPQQCTPTSASCSTAASAPDKQVDGGVGREGEGRVHHLRQRRFVEHHDLGALGQHGGDPLVQRLHVLAHRPNGNLEGQVDRHAGAHERRTECERTDELPLHRAGGPDLGGELEERPQPGERGMIDVRLHVGERIDAAHVHGEAAVLPERHAPHADHGLRDQAFGRRALRQVGDRREGRQLLEDEAGGR